MCCLGFNISFILTCEDDVGHVVSSVAATVVLVLVVEELLVSGVLQAQGPLGVGGELVLVGAAAAQTAVVQGQTVALVFSRELKQEERGRESGFVLKS